MEIAANPNEGKMFQVRMWPMITVAGVKGPSHRKGEEQDALLLDHDRFLEFAPEFKIFAGVALFKATKPFFITKDGQRFTAVVKRIA